VYKPKTLNEDPFNVRAEELAVEQCQKGFNVEQQLNETDMLVTSCGCLIPGTPDGGFVDSNGDLTLVQVVRVPLLPDMDADTVGDVLYSTVLAKVVKSQQWMKATRTLPREFIIFCWLPPVGAYQTCLEQSDALLWTEALMWNVREGGWPFTLKVVDSVPFDPGSIFPMNFGLNADKHTQAKLDYFHDICFTMDAEEFVDAGDDDEPMEWYLFADAVESDSEEEAIDASTSVDADHEAMFDVNVLLALIVHFLEKAEHVQQLEWQDLNFPGDDIKAFTKPPSAPEIIFYWLGYPELLQEARDREGDGCTIPLLIEAMRWWEARCTSASSHRDAKPAWHPMSRSSLTMQCAEQGSSQEPLPSLFGVCKKLSIIRSSVVKGVMATFYICCSFDACYA
jgi:hypothetical protein